jgi:hypothetical protein
MQRENAKPFAQEAEKNVIKSTKIESFFFYCISPTAGWC